MTQQSPAGRYADFIIHIINTYVIINLYYTEFKM